MVAVVQRVSKASVSIADHNYSKIEKGLLVLLGIGHDDNQEDADWLSQKIINMRIFSDQDNKMNLALKDIKGQLLVVSQFTLHASTKKGNRPSFIEAARPEHAIPLYKYFIKCCEEEMGENILTGEFGADMKIELINDGPVTIIIDTKNKK